MKIGDLVEKSSGHSSKDRNLVGIVLAVSVKRSTAKRHVSGFCKRLQVLSCNSKIESWYIEFCEVVNESR